MSKQAWKQLSRFQRSLVYMVAGIALLLGALYYMSMEKQLVCT